MSAPCVLREVPQVRSWWLQRRKGFGVRLTILRVCDLFGMVICDPLKGESWPPTIGESSSVTAWIAWGMLALWFCCWCRFGTGNLVSACCLSGEAKENPRFLRMTRNDRLRNGKKHDWRPGNKLIESNRNQEVCHLEIAPEWRETLLQYIRQYSNLPPSQFWKIWWTGYQKLPISWFASFTDSKHYELQGSWSRKHEFLENKVTRYKFMLKHRLPRSSISKSSSVMNQNLLRPSLWPNPSSIKKLPSFWNEPWFVGQFWDSMFLFPFWWDISELIYIVPWTGNQVVLHPQRPAEMPTSPGSRQTWTVAATDVRKCWSEWRFAPLTFQWKPHDGSMGRLYVY